MTSESPSIPQPNAPAPKFVASGCSVMMAAIQVATARSKTMAKRIANALNCYKPNREGV